MLVFEASAGMVRVGRGFFQDGIRINNLAGNEIRADTEVLKRPLGLGSPEFVGGGTLTSPRLSDSVRISLPSEADETIGISPILLM